MGGEFFSWARTVALSTSQYPGFSWLNIQFAGPLKKKKHLEGFTESDHNNKGFFFFFAQHPVDYTLKSMIALGSSECLKNIATVLGCILDS